MRTSFSTQTIVRLRYPLTTDQGTEMPDFTAAPAESTIDGCWYEPMTSTVIENGRLAVRTGYTVDAPARVDLSAFRDHVRIKDDEFKLDGDPLAVPSPTGALDSTRFTCTRWEG